MDIFDLQFRDLIVFEAFRGFGSTHLITSCGMFLDNELIVKRQNIVK